MAEYLPPDSARTAIISAPGTDDGVNLHVAKMM
jgi:hypothetical protein